MHQYIDNETSEIKTEHLLSDREIKFIYSAVREHAPTLFKALTSKRFSSILGYINFDAPILSKIIGVKAFAKKMKINLDECLLPPEKLSTPKKLFERQIKYWKCRPMDKHPYTVVSPADAKTLVGSFSKNSKFYIKNKFFMYDEILGKNKEEWLDAFDNGDFAIFRLTPEKYHYNHTPVAGIVKDIYEIDGVYHSCNPKAVVEIITPYSKNKRVVTIIDTNVKGGSQVGLVAMIEIVAMMIGDIYQCYSDKKYKNPQAVKKGLFIKKGQPKSLFRPGSSTDILIFQKDKIEFVDSLIKNQLNLEASSIFTFNFGQHLVETDLNVRTTIAWKK
jgi:phosphatidylserine decarboxylase